MNNKFFWKHYNSRNVHKTTNWAVFCLHFMHTSWSDMIGLGLLLKFFNSCPNVDLKLNLVEVISAPPK